MYDALTARSLLVAHEEVELDTAMLPGAYRVLRPDRIPFVSLPYEWCFSQLRAAALLTLEVQAISLSHGMILKDASAFNVLFRGTAPIFVDTLSFMRVEEGQPWVAYRQFCRHFLAPLALQGLVDVRVREMQRSYLDGIPLDLASRLLPAHTWLRPWAVMHIHAHARAISRFSSTRVAPTPPNRKVSRTGLDGLTEHLGSAIKAIEWSPGPTEWADYEESHGYSDIAHAAKRSIVERLLRQAGPTGVLDLGANTGEYSRLARALGAEVIALDGDPGAVERTFKRCLQDGETGITPLWVDLTNPSPAQGWAHKEWPALAARGRVDVVLALALVHHLAIGHNIPLTEIASYLARLGRSVVIEWVPKSDPQVQRLLVSRKDIFASYSEENFVAAMKESFSLVERAKVDSSGRVIYSFATSDSAHRKS